MFTVFSVKFNLTRFSFYITEHIDFVGPRINQNLVQRETESREERGRTRKTSTQDWNFSVLLVSKELE